MSRLGLKSLVYHGDSCLGELDAIPTKDRTFQFPNNEIRIHHISSNSERCHPLSVLQTVSPFSVRCKLESSSIGEQQQLINLHASCFYELKTAVVLTGDEEIHLVAMRSKQKRFPCFWCFSVPCGLYTACSGMLNMRCLSIVFDLDETLIVANTMKSFEDRIEALRNWIARGNDLIRISGMSAEMKRYVDDRALLKQYTESDFVHDGGEMYKVQPEEVPLVSGGQDKVVRPVIRLPEKNIVLTRINPENRDTSVLVRLRPAWEDLRSYLTAKGRKRFEVFVCTMAERDYALEMWRLLDPEAHLISSKQLLERIVCVKSGARKSLLNVFQNGNCHPRMAMIIDDRLKVWEDKDQPRVHVVPAFTPYYAPQAETANAVPILCVARNVACNVRGCFFKEFDENLLRKISERFYEDEVVNLPYAPDVSNYMMSEDASFIPNGNGNAPFAEGISGPEVAQRLSQSGEKNLLESVALQTTNGPELRSENSQLPMPTVPQVFAPASSKPLLPAEKPSLLGVPFRRDSIFSEPEPDAKKRSFLMNHGQDVRYRGVAGPPLLHRLPGQLPGPSLQSQEGLLVEEDNKGQFNNSYSGIVQDLHALRHDKRGRQNLLGQSATTFSPLGGSSYVAQVKSEEASPGNEMQKQTYPSLGQLSEVGRLSNHSSLNGKEIPTEGEKVNLPSLSIGVLQEIGRRCSSKVEFRSVVGTGEGLQFSVEVYFTGEKIGTGMGKTRKDAQQQAAENALRNLADEYVSYTIPRSGAGNSDSIKHSPADENGFVWDVTDPGPVDMVVEAVKDHTSEMYHRERRRQTGRKLNAENVYIHDELVTEVLQETTSANVVNKQVQKRGI